jgi:hypothetical protein
LGRGREVIGTAIEGLRGRDLRSLSDGALNEGFGELQKACEALEAERLRWLGEIDRRRSFAKEGHPSATSWLMHTHKVPGSSAHQDVRTARSLWDMPLTRRALVSGAVSPSAARVLVSAREAHPDRFPAHERSLVDAARSLPPRELGHHVTYWRHTMDSQGALAGAERLHHRRRLAAWPVPSGMARMEGEFDPEAGQTVITALRAVMDSDVRSGGGPDDRTADQRRADAMEHLCRFYLDSADRPIVGGERPHLTVLVDPETMQGRPGTSELTDTGPIHPQMARMWACDASVTRVVMGPDSVPLDVGRSTPVVPPGMRKAVMARDRHCTFPGCRRPPSWTDVHHVRHWSDGGATAVGNLTLLCRLHHRLIHRSGFRVEMRDGRPVFYRPGGTVMAERGPPVRV